MVRPWDTGHSPGHRGTAASPDTQHRRGSHSGRMTGSQESLGGSQPITEQFLSSQPTRE